MPSHDNELSDLVQKLHATKITEYTKDTARECLTAALEKIDSHEGRIFNKLNAELFKAGPFDVQCYDYQPCCITFGSRLISKIEQTCSVGSAITIGNLKPRSVLSMDGTKVMVDNSRGLVKTGTFTVEFVQKSGKQEFILEQEMIPSFLFPPHHDWASYSSVVKDLDQTHFGLNLIQREAIVKALHPLPSTPVPRPFLIRGPPGTGKTTTLIEMILQILKMERLAMRPHPFIIVCAPSNRAADNVIERIPTKADVKVLRLISAAEKFKLKSKKILPGIDYSTEVSEKFEVVVSTIGKLQSYYKENGVYQYKPPTHIIIDEASMVADTDMIFVLGLLRSSTKFIMFGDDKQLSPVITVDDLRNSFLETSMFERLLKDKDHERASVCLLENYRSCPGVVAPFNNLFYESKLIAKVNEFEYPQLFQQLRLIHRTLMGQLSGGNPTGVYFQRVKGYSKRGQSNSWSNAEETKKIVKIFHSLLDNGVPAAEIGIITPYTDQVNLIKNKIKISSVGIGSVDSFQGQERNVIIVSTVRSFKGKGIGFVGDAKRLNVTLSRAKTALVIVGNDGVLKKNELFNKFFDQGGIHFIK